MASEDGAASVGLGDIGVESAFFQERIALGKSYGAAGIECLVLLEITGLQSRAAVVSKEAGAVEIGGVVFEATAGEGGVAVVAIGAAAGIGGVIIGDEAVFDEGVVAAAEDAAAAVVGSGVVLDYAVGEGDGGSLFAGDGAAAPLSDGVFDDGTMADSWLAALEADDGAAIAAVMADIEDVIVLEEAVSDVGAAIMDGEGAAAGIAGDVSE